MAPALALRRATLGRIPLVSTISRNNPSICLFCSLAPASRRLSRQSPLKPHQRTAALLNNTPRRLYSADIESKETSFSDAHLSQPKLRAELSTRLRELQSQFPQLIDQPARLKLALRNLSEPPGQESIRVAILNPVDSSLPSSAASDTTVKRLVRAILADELGTEAEWERRLAGHDFAHNPLVVRVEQSVGGQEAGAQSREEGGGAIPEIVSSSPALGRLGLELLVSRVDARQLRDGQSVEDALLVPKVHRHGSREIDLEKARETSDVATPVHYTLLVGNGLQGAVSALALAKTAKKDEGSMVELAVDFRTALEADDLGAAGQKLPFISLNVDAANRGLEAMRSGRADEFMEKWLEGNASKVREWLKKNSSVQDGAAGEAIKAKPAVTALVKSILSKARSRIQGDERRQSRFVAGSDVDRLHKSLEDWAQDAHEELQQQLTIASTKKSWRKLSWWKLFWRADDVGRITSDMVAAHFLPEAEKSIIHLAGRIDETVAKVGKHSVQPSYESPASGEWPAQIPHTRNLIQEHTVPTLQALAQKLVIRSAGISGLSAGLAGLSYFYSAGAYECGAIAALGVVLSFRQIQTRWEKAQRYWETEVREEGRKAIRSTENSILKMLSWASEGQVVEARRKEEEEAEKAREIIERAEEALKRL
ncbi:hypothetical protein QBC42DRAFT_271853 [Cladorrhinum samala]|uniref:Mmc1 C-terminal domain-containing protein n=1 Tax=Cladorrhinum samala TaxID=585594 RepID=A0AAV9HK36_9PEZI|nr:hypothetical protein QBC42DRAFT_271853 [Cladorrhinum samala]